jgi:SAM-dependent methyltransferase
METYKYSAEKISQMYKLRFPAEELAKKGKLWKVLIDEVLQKYVKDNDSVLDIGGGECLFINNIKCGKKFVCDLNPDVKEYANSDVTVIQQSAENISDISDKSIDVVFVSNFFEHLKDKSDLEKVIAEIKRILAPGGLLLVIQPNIKYAYKEYWDFHDHYIPITDGSLAELLMINNFEIKICYPKFLPWRPKGKLSNFMILFKIYLRFPLLWRIFGKQLFIVAQNC